MSAGYFFGQFTNYLTSYEHGREFGGFW